MENPSMPAVLVVGLGNPILGDDGVGWRVAEGIQAWLDTTPLEVQGLPVSVEMLSLGGLSLMERLIDCTHVLIIDAINTQAHPPGHISLFPLADLPNQAASHLSSAHDTSLQNALQVGRSMGANLPAHIIILGIESPFVYDFSEQLSPEVAASVPLAIQSAIHQLTRWRSQTASKFL